MRRSFRLSHLVPSEGFFNPTARGSGLSWPSEEGAALQYPCKDFAGGRDALD